MSSVPVASQTLAEKLSKARLPVADALRYAMSLADALRKLHDAGQVSGGIEPSNVIVRLTGLDLAPGAPANTATAYTAPEVLAGQAPDVPSDIFSYGTVLYEMLTGRPAFTGADTDEIAAAVTGAQVAPTGSPAVDRLLASCLAKDPAARCQRMQKVILELRMLTVGTRHTEVPKRDTSLEAALRSEMQQIEARLTTRLDGQQKTSTELYQSTAQVLVAMRGELATLIKQLADSHSQGGAARAAIAADLQRHVDASSGRLNDLEQALEGGQTRLAELEQTAVQADQLKEVGANVEAHAARLAQLEQSTVHADRLKEVDANVEAQAARVAQLEQTAVHVDQLKEVSANADAHAARLAEAEESMAAHHGRLEQLEDTTHGFTSRVEANEQALAEAVEHGRTMEAGMAELHQRFDQLQQLFTDDMQSLENALRGQGAQLESARTAMAQTDDLVERVVEALESLQSTILEQTEDRTHLPVN